MSNHLSLAVFAYDFPHYRSQQALMKFVLSGHRPDVIFGAPFKKLSFYQSERRFTPNFMDLFEPRDLAAELGIDYIAVEHNSSEVRDEVTSRNLDLGLITGARILDPSIIDVFNVGVLNPHPGIIPINRGLETIKWCITERIPIGVTTHLIDSQIDMGQLIDIQIVDVYPDDTLIDVYLRQLELMQQMTVEGIEKLESGFRPSPITEEGKYNGGLPAEDDALLLEWFEEYKKDYIEIVKEYQSRT